MSQVKSFGGSGISGSSAQGSTEGVRQKYRKGDRTRRLWTAREEEILAESMMELTARGWKSDNGFRTGYLQRIEDDLRKEFPNTNLKGTPHVVSKISAWKNNFNSLWMMLSTTGVGLNPDRNAKFMRHKSWPLWEEWNVIFGKDRASGGVSEDIADGATAVRTENAARYENHNDDPSNDYVVNLDDLFDQPPNPQLNSTPDSHHTESTGQSEQREQTPTKIGKKRKSVSIDAGLLEFLGQMHSETN